MTWPSIVSRDETPIGPQQSRTMNPYQILPFRSWGECLEGMSKKQEVRVEKRSTLAPTLF